MIYCVVRGRAYWKWKAKIRVWCGECRDFSSGFGRVRGKLQLVGDDGSRHTRDGHVSHGIAEVPFDAGHRASFLLGLLDELIFGSDGDVLDPLDLHAARPIGESLVLLRRLPVRHVHRHQIMLQLRLQLLVRLQQRRLLLSETHAVDPRTIEAHPKHVEFLVHLNHGLRRERWRDAINVVLLNIPSLILVF
jgi:hypothetical protein